MISELVPVTLVVTEATLQALPRLLRAKSLRPSRPTTRRWRLVYWDTPDLRLYRARSVLVLVRRGRGRWLQRYYRELYSRRLPILGDAASEDGAPDARGLDDPRLRGALRPYAERDVMRTVRTIRLRDECEVTLSIDRGRARVIDATPRWRAILEIELALLAGTAEHLYELASVIVDELPGARLLFDSEAERAYGGLAGAVERPRSARRVDADPREPLARLVANATAECIAQIAENVEGAKRGSDDEALHQLRVGVRRLRSIVRVAPAAGLAPLPEDARARLKWLWKLLGEARDWDVFMAQTLPEIRRIVDPASAERFEAVAAGLRKRSHVNVNRALRGKPFHLAMLTLARLSARQCAEAAAHGEGSSRRLAKRLLSVREARLLRRGRHVGRRSREALHELRVGVKRLRYLGEFLAVLFDQDESGRYLKCLATVQSALGRLNDLVVAEQLVRILESRCAAFGVAHDWHPHAASRERALRGELRENWKAFRQCRPFWR
ncbi:MAG: CHAD domain-containing protein [Rudaea sp.]